MRGGQDYGVELTLALPHVHIELLQGPHGHLPDISLQEQLQQGGGEVLTGRHAGCLRHLTLRVEKEWTGRGRERKNRL